MLNNFDKYCDLLDADGNMRRKNWLFILNSKKNTLRLPDCAVSMIWRREKYLKDSKSDVIVGLVVYAQSVRRSLLKKDLNVVLAGAVANDFVENVKKYFQTKNANVVAGPWSVNSGIVLPEPAADTDAEVGSTLHSEIGILKEAVDRGMGKLEIYFEYPDLARKWSEFIDLYAKNAHSPISESTDDSIYPVFDLERNTRKEAGGEGKSLKIVIHPSPALMESTEEMDRGRYEFIC